MDLQDQLKTFSQITNHFPEEKKYHMNYIRSKEPMICKLKEKEKQPPSLKVMKEDEDLKS
jgi:hypothetical protein